MIDFVNIKNIIFDLGGVIVDINPQLSINLFNKMGINTSNEYYKLMQTEVFKNFEIGKINASEFRKNIKKISGKNFTDKEIDNSWNAMIGDFESERIKFISNLRSRYNLFLLSNTNEIHEKYFNEKFFKQFNYDFANLFDKVYYSHHIGLRKPDKEVFFKVLYDSSINANETIFIDDFEPNIISAKETGMHCHWLKPDEKLHIIFKNLL